MEQTLQQIKTDRTKSRYLRAFKAAFPYTIPVLTGFAVLGIAYGLLMASNGYGVLWAFLMSAIGFGGSVQYAMVPLLTTVFDPLQAFLLSFMINARHLFYGLSMLGKYKGLGRVLPPAMMGLLVVYCLRNVSLIRSPHGIPELIAIAVIVALHKWKENVLLSIGTGTVVYMLLVQLVF